MASKRAKNSDEDPPEPRPTHVDDLPWETLAHILGHNTDFIMLHEIAIIQRRLGVLDTRQLLWTNFLSTLRYNIVILPFTIPYPAHALVLAIAPYLHYVIVSGFYKQGPTGVATNPRVLYETFGATDLVGYAQHASGYSIYHNRYENDLVDAVELPRKSNLRFMLAPHSAVRFIQPAFHPELINVHCKLLHLTLPTNGLKFEPLQWHLNDTKRPWISSYYALRLRSFAYNVRAFEDDQRVIDIDSENEDEDPADNTPESERADPNLWMVGIGYKSRRIDEYADERWNFSEWTAMLRRLRVRFDGWFTYLAGEIEYKDVFTLVETAFAQHFQNLISLRAHTRIGNFNPAIDASVDVKTFRARSMYAGSLSWNPELPEAMEERAMFVESVGETDGLYFTASGPPVCLENTGFVIARSRAKRVVLSVDVEAHSGERSRRAVNELLTLLRSIASNNISGHPIPVMVIFSSGTLPTNPPRMPEHLTHHSIHQFWRGTEIPGLPEPLENAEQNVELLFDHTFEILPNLLANQADGGKVARDARRDASGRMRVVFDSARIEHSQLLESISMFREYLV
jgi:hypothetical protein